ncbi:type II toxin-antitoxin system VapC family toxin [Azohydromonas caseinilytica]|uniref:Ribonuclease VapC n=1 Tax=Azohydromonas caseinilytica TaxID=2728836 RepID=A0A848FHF8_9BURK|nr:type II toxin-antitoxin system VapC family toxin [Azohydromonas caseinilytica]NML17693.1 type II toxin-antitoxin system VapC family toxin [Azohydromonas caseinilytica]
MRRVYVDTCLLIYWVEGQGALAQAATAWLVAHQDAVLCVSPLVRLEVLVKPLRGDQHALVQAYDELLAQQVWLPIGDEVFAQALDLRVRHGLKTPDALHLATALHHGCSELWTNDDRLKAAAGALAVNVLQPTP